MAPTNPGSIAPPKWESFQRDNNEPGNDFPAGPYYRMVAKLYGTSSELLEFIERTKLEKLSHSKSLKRDFTSSLDANTVNHSLAVPPVTNLISTHVNAENNIVADQSNKAGEFGQKTHHAASSENRLLVVHGQDINVESSNNGVHFGTIQKSLPLSSVANTQDVRFDKFGSTEPRHTETMTSDVGFAMKSIGDNQCNDLIQESFHSSSPASYPPGYGYAPPMNNPSAKIVSSESHQHKINPGAKDINSPSGVIFMCNERTKPICFSHRLFGLPLSQSGLVQRIVPGTKLFLFVTDSRMLLGIFEATSHGGMNLENRVFGGMFPSQVRFVTLRECRPLCEAEFKDTIKENYFTFRRFSSELTTRQVSSLLKLFCPDGLPVEQNHGDMNFDHLNPVRSGLGAPLDATESQSEMSMEISSPQTTPQNFVQSHPILGSNSYEPANSDTPRQYHFTIVNKYQETLQYSKDLQGSTGAYEHPNFSRPSHGETSGLQMLSAGGSRHHHASPYSLHREHGLLHKEVFVVDGKSNVLETDSFESRGPCLNKRDFTPRPNIVNGSYDNEHNRLVYDSDMQSESGFYANGSHLNNSTTRYAHDGAFHIQETAVSNYIPANPDVRIDDTQSYDLQESTCHSSGHIEINGAGGVHGVHIHGRDYNSCRVNKHKSWDTSLSARELNEPRYGSSKRVARQHNDGSGCPGASMRKRPR